MVSEPDYREVYGGPEFERWAYARGLIEAEKFLIERYLTKANETLEAGTGGGRILLEMANKGFENLAGFDGVAPLIEAARRTDLSGKIRFDVQDARELSYGMETFSQVIYLQQIVCFIGEAEGRSRAVAEAHRILKPGGIALFSFLLYEVRSSSRMHSAVMGYLAALRTIRGRDTSPQYMPWFSHRGRPNLGVLLDRPPYVYWFRCEEAVELLASQGFTITGAGTLRQIQQGRLCASVRELQKEPLEGMLYVVCRKGASDGAVN